MNNSFPGFFPSNPPLACIWQLEEAYHLFATIPTTILCLCINPETKETKWVTCLKDAHEFYRKVTIGVIVVMDLANNLAEAKRAAKEQGDAVVVDSADGRIVFDTQVKNEL